MLYSDCVSEHAVLRIGELSKRSGVSPELLRAWERRYDLLRPVRSPGGLRLYSVDDLERVQLMRRHLDDGLAAAEAAALASRAEPAGAPRSRPGGASPSVTALAHALDRFDEPAAQAAIDEVLAAATVDTLLTAVVLPYLNELGERWHRGDASIAQEHFASSVLRGRLLGLARGWGRGLGPLALLASLPGEEHELGLIAFGLALRARGWRIGYLGADTPLETVAEVADSLDPTVVVLNAVTGERVTALAPQLAELARRHRLAIGGAGAADVPADSELLALVADPVAEAERVTALVQPLRARRRLGA
jgi:DNA-binding transcriptional MerR regulator